MSENHRLDPQDQRPNRRRAQGPLAMIAGVGGRAASAALRPLAAPASAAAEAGLTLERRAVDRLLESDELGRIVNAAIDNPHVQAAVEQALASEGATRLVDSLVDSGLVDRLMTRLFDSGAIDRLLYRLVSSDALWDVVDEVAASPTVTAAISQQGLGFADQVGEEVRARSRTADDWIERTARRLAHRPPRTLPPEPEPGV